MGIEHIYADRIEAGFQRELRNPTAPEAPSFSMWSFLGSGLKGPVSAGLEKTGSALDFLSGFATPFAASMGDEQARQKMLAGDAYDVSQGNVLRRKADEFAPDPETGHKANQVLHGLTRGISKAVADVFTLGPVAGPIAFGLDEGNTATQKLREKGVDTETATKVGVVRGALSAVSVALPAAGQTALGTLGLAVAGGPAPFMAEEALTRRILQSADYSELAQQHDPFDPLGLALSTVLPGVIGGIHVRGLAKAKSLEKVVEHIESGGRRYGKDGKLLTSPKGAQGEMQVMPGTAADPGFGVTPARDGSAEELARVGREYLAAMTNRYDSADKALAAYNAGPGAVDAAIKAHGEKWLDFMPDETKAYVGKAQRLLGEHVIASGAADPEVVAAARVKVTDDALMRSMPDHPEARAEVMAAADELNAGRFPDVEPAPIPRLPGAPVLNTPRVPTAEEMGMHAKVESVPIAQAYSTQAARQWDRFDAGDHPPPVVAGYADKPVAVRLRSGEYLVLDGHHRTELAMKAGADEVPMHVIDAAKYDPQNAGRANSGRVKSKIDDDELMRELMAPPDPAIGNSGKFDPDSPSLTDPLKPGELSPRRGVRPAPEATNALPDADSPTIDPAKAADSKTDGPSPEAQRVAKLAEEMPDLRVKLPGSDETLTIEAALKRAKEEADYERTEADLVKAAFECALMG